MERGCAVDEAHSCAILQKGIELMGKLTITFSGVCTHFSAAIPDLHRVVLPNAAAFHLGILQMPPGGEPVGYYLQPHLAIIQTSSSDVTFPGNPANPTVPNVMRDGYIYAGALLEVPNASGLLQYDESYWNDVRPLSDFVPEFIYSADVVLNKRAVCYFDVRHGVISAGSTPAGAVYVLITITTDGPPQLRLTPFQTDIPVDISNYLVIDEQGNAAITVANIEIGDVTEDVPFDYILHYLTAQSGIPPALSSQTPGMFDWQPLSPSNLAVALDSLANLVNNLGPTADQAANFNADLVDPSCSDSRYP
jgi:hypothetical protein